MSTDHLSSRRTLLDLSGVRPERDTTVTRVRRDVYLPSAAPTDEIGRYLLRIRAAHRTLTADHVFSHESSAALLGLPILGRWPEKVHLIAERRSGGRSQLDVVRHCLGLEDVVPWVLDGMLLTGPARTAFDFALARPFVDAVVVADAAFRLYPGSREEFAQLLAAYGRRRGFQKARAVLEFADARSGSVGESYSRTEIHRLGFARPELQVRVTTAGRDEFADFGWRRARALGEFDGENKYRDDRYRAGGEVVDVVIREKNRENRLRAQWPNLARWDWTDLRTGMLGGILTAAGVPRDLPSGVVRGPARWS